MEESKRDPLIQLGDEARDTITGYKGIVVGVTDWLYQCRRLGIQPKSLKKDGAPSDIHWFDELQCEPVAANGGKSEAVDEKGGPMPTPNRNKEPQK